MTMIEVLGGTALLVVGGAIGLLSDIGKAWYQHRRERESQIIDATSRFVACTQRLSSLSRLKQGMESVRQEHAMLQWPEDLPSPKELDSQVKKARYEFDLAHATLCQHDPAMVMVTNSILASHHARDYDLVDAKITCLLANRIKKVGRFKRLPTREEVLAEA